MSILLHLSPDKQDAVFERRHTCLLMLLLLLLLVLLMLLLMVLMMRMLLLLLMLMWRCYRNRPGDRSFLS